MQYLTGRSSRPAERTTPVASGGPLHGPPPYEEELREAPYEEELREAEGLLLRLEESQREQALATNELREILGRALSRSPAVPAEHCPLADMPHAASSPGDSEPLIPKEGVESAGAGQAQEEKSRLQGLVGSDRFEIATAVLVVCYSLCLGVDVHIAMTTTLGTRANIPECVDSYLPYAFAFLVCAYCVEMALRVAAHGKKFFCGDKWKWNLMDLCILMFTVLDLAITLTHTANQKLQFLVNFRSLRFLRFLRNLRIVSVIKLIPDLRKMIWAVFSCTKSFVWGMVLMLITFYGFAIFLEDSAMHILIAERNKRESLGAAGHELDKRIEKIEGGLKEYWDGMYRGMLSLIFSVSGGQDWANIGDPFLEINIFYGSVFTGFIFISLFGTLNVLVGVFVQKSGEIEQWEHNLVLKEAMEESDQHHEIKKLTLKELFEKVARGERTIKVGDLIERSNDENILRYFRHLGIHLDIHHGIHGSASGSSEIFESFDLDRDGELNEAEFVQVCRRLQGSAMPAQLEHLNRKVDSLLSATSVTRQSSDRPRPSAT